MSYFFRYLALAAFLSACASPIRVNLPSNRFHSPEILSAGTTPFNLQSGTHTYNRIVLTEDAFTQPLHTNPASMTQHFWATDDVSNDTSLDTEISEVFEMNPILIRAGLALFAIPVEFFYEYLTTIGMKFQLFGARSANASAGNLSMSWTAAFSRSTQTQTSGSLTSEPNYAAYVFRKSEIDTSLVFGYRIVDQVVLYGGPFITHIPYNITQNTSSSSADLDKISGAINNFGGHLGVQLFIGQSFNIMLEGTASTLEAYGAEEVFYNTGVSLAGSL